MCVCVSMSNVYGVVRMFVFVYDYVFVCVWEGLFTFVCMYVCACAWVFNRKKIMGKDHACNSVILKTF